MEALIDLRNERTRAIQKADETVAAAERAHRPLSTVESQIVKQCTDQANSLGAEIQRIENVRATKFAEVRATLDTLMPHVNIKPKGSFLERMVPKTFTADYANGFFEFFRSRGSRVSAALEESSNTAGGYAVPSITDQTITPLAPSDYAVRNLATVVPTVCDRRIAKVTALPTAAAKGEGSAFGSSNSTIGQVTLSAYTVGVEQDASFEIFEDVVLFNETVLRDSVLALQEFEEGKFLSGSGSGEPQGLLGNVGAGITGVLAGSDSYASELLTATFDVVGAVKSRYLSNSSFLMSRATATTLRKAQAGSIFEKVFTRENGVDLLHGYPIAYSDSMPSIGASNTPVLFGDVAACYIIGDRGGSAVSMKIVDQSSANVLNGIVSLLLYRRTDGRVRCPEAVQGITLHS